MRWSNTRQLGVVLIIVEIHFNYDNDLAAAADYYWTARSSVGVSLSTQEGYNFGLNAQHFFSPTIAARIEFVSLDLELGMKGSTAKLSSFVASA